MTNTILLGIGMFFFMLIVHVIIWNLLSPNGEIIPLFINFIFLPIPLFIAQYIWEIYPLSHWEVSLGILLYYALSGCYIQTFPAITTKIPSFRILMLLYHKGPLTEEDINIVFEQEEMVESRINLLQQDSLVKIIDGRFILNRHGSFLAIIFLKYRRFLGLTMGKG